MKESQATSLQKLSDQEMGQDLEMATRRPTALDMEKAPKLDNQDGADARQDDSPSTSGNSGNKRSNSGTGKAIDLIGGIAFQSNEDVDDGVESGDGVEGSDRGASNSPANDKCVTSSNSPPLLELSLKRPRALGDEDNTEKRVIRHSGGSAFSRYSTTGGTTIQQIPPGTPLTLSGCPVGAAYGTHSLSPAPGSLGTGTNVPGRFATPLDRAGSSKGSGEGFHPQPTHPRPSHRGKGQDVGSSMVGSSIPEGYSQQVKDETVSVSPISGQGRPISIPLPPRGMLYDGVSAAYGQGQAMHAVYYSHSGAPPWASGGAHFSDRGQVFDHPPYHDHGSHTAHHSSHHQQQAHRHSRLPQPSLLTQRDDQAVTNQVSGAPGCGSSNMADGNTGQSGSSNGYGSTGNGNGSVNGSGSGSNNMTTQNGQSCVVVNATENVDCAGINGSAPGEPNGAINHEQNRFTRREAALNKFRQKRKERCFEKKVRYQSRKRLAEQRPRVRGQFVRQPVYEPNAGNEMTD
jgi:pseudo-response regulator 7